jgi:hypothetical protein
MNTILDNLKIRPINHFEREKALVGIIGRLEGRMTFIASSLDSGDMDADDASMSIKMMLKQSENEFNELIHG